MGRSQQVQLCGCGCGRPGQWRGMCKQTYDRTRYRQRAYGRWQESTKVPADAARAHLQQLEAAGVNRAQVAQLAGLGPSTISRIAQPEWENIRQQVEYAILSIEIPDRAADVTAPNALVPITGARRRIQALVADGHPISHLAQELGIPDRGNSMAALVGRPDPHGHIGTHIHAERECAVKDLFDRLQLTPGPSDQARAYARTRGWPLPLEWDEDDLDRPDGRPTSSRRTEWTDLLSRREERRQQREERDERVMRLLTYQSAAEVAEIVGVTQRTIERIKAEHREDATEAEDEEIELTEDEW